MPPTYRFADLTLDTDRYSVERGDAEIELPRLSYELLLALARTAPNVLTHDDIVQQVWAGRFVSQETITQRVKLLRDALEDDAAQPRYIRAVRGRGYRLIPEVVDSDDVTLPAGWNRRRLAFSAGFVFAAAALFFAVQLYVDSPDTPESLLTVAPSSPSIAVLPFENLGPDAEHAHFVDGMHNELLTYLSRIRGIKVISRSSVMEYRNRPVNVREIGAELGAASVLEGTVQRVDDTVRINVQLLDAETDGHLWAGVYDRELTANNLFAIQTEMATAIADALQATLTPQEVASLSEVPTQSTQVWDDYLRGNDYFRRADDRVFMPRAVEAYERAVAVDPGFALGWAALSRAHTRMYWYDLDRSRFRTQRALEAAEQAFQLSPDLPEAHIAMSNYHQLVSRDYDRALAELALAERDMPGAAELFEARAFIYRRLGRWDQSAANFQRALEIDPRNVDFLIQQSGVYQYWRRCDEAIANMDRVLEIAPDHPWGHFLAVMHHVLCYGDVAPARAAAQGSQTMRFRELAGWIAAVYDRDYDTALAYLDEWMFDVHTFNYTYIPRASFYAVTYRLAGRQELAEREFRAAREHLEAKLLTDPEDPRIFISLAEAMLGLGEREEAVRLAQRATELMPLSRDVMIGSDIRREAIVRVLAPAGANDAAIEHLVTYLEGPGRWSLEGLLADPGFDPIRDDPRLNALVEEHGRR